MKKLFLLFWFLLVASQSFAQGEANVWYFGTNAGVDFNSGAPVALTNGVLSTSEGCASISDKSGNLRFYSDGIQVWTRNHIQMPNGFGLMGNPSSAQSAIIVPKPGNSTLFYLFTVDDAGGPDGLRYSVIDMTLNGSLGDVVAATKNTLLFTPSAEKITAVKHTNGLYVWVLAHGMNSNRYYAYLVDCNGVQAPITTDVGRVEGWPGWGYLVASPNGQKLASAMNTIGFELLDFDNATGVVSNPAFLGVAGACYGVSFSPNNNVLYGLKISAGQIYQWNVQAGSPAAIAASGTFLGTARGTSAPYQGGAMQLGPDGKLYICQYQQPFLSVINQPDVLGPGCNLQFNAVNLSGRDAVLGLPPFIQSYFDTTAVIQSNGNCANHPVNFSISSTTTFLDSVRWDFGDPASGMQNSSTTTSPSHIYSSAGTYAVQLIRYVACIADTAHLQVNVIGPELLAQDVTICTSVTFTRPNGTVVSTQGTYRDTLSAFSGCDSIITTNLFVLGASITASNDTAICAGNSVPLNVQGGLFGYTWSPATGLSDSSSSTPLATPQQTTSYVVHTRVASDELISNGNFTAGGGGFLSSYTSTTNLYPEGTYYVGSNPNAYHSGFNGCGDHTSGAGNMLIVNGAGSPGLNVWCQTVNVLPNTDYAFSSWVTSVVAGSPAILQFSINGSLLGSPFNAPGSSCPWQQFYIIWNSGSNSIASICVVNQNTTLGGNDFALDDISFIGLCNATDTVTITVHQPFTTSVDTSLCQGLSYTFPDGATSAVSATNTSFLFSHSGCDSTVITNLVITPPPVTDIYDSICFGQSYTRPGGIVISDAGDYTDSLATFAGCDSIVLTHLTVKPLKTFAFSDSICIGSTYTLPDGTSTDVAGSYPVLLQALNGCDSTITVTLTTLDVAVNVSPAITISLGEQIQLSATSAFDPQVSYNWTPSTALSCDNCAAPFAAPQDSIIYHMLAVANINGNTCYDSSSVFVGVLPDHTIFVPNAFTPDGDGTNDFFQIFGNLHAVHTLEVLIFDRTGDKVFESNDITFEWDGTYKGKILNPAVFVYNIRATFVDIYPQKIYKGSVTLIR